MAINQLMNPNKQLSANQSNDNFENVQMLQGMIVLKATNTCCTRFSSNLKITIQEPHLLKRIFLYIFVMSLGCVTCYIIFQSLYYGFFKKMLNF